STGEVIRAVTEDRAAIGVLAMPQEGEADPWWRQLVSKDENAPRVVARLPFGARGNARGDGGEALAIGRGTQQETGADRTLLATEIAAGTSRGRILRILSAVGLNCTFFASCEHSGGAINLIEIDGFVPISDARLDGLRAQLGEALHRMLPFGGYALPIPVATLNDRARAGSAPVVAEA